MSRIINFGQNTISSDRFDGTNTITTPNARMVLIGRFERGPVGVPTVVTDYDDLTAKFGFGDPTIGTDRLPTEMIGYKLTTGTSGDALVLRLFESPATSTASEPAGAAQIRVNAANAGLWGNNLQRAIVTRTVAAGAQATVYVREVINGVLRRSASSTFLLTPAGIAQAQIDLANIATIVYAVGAVTVANGFTLDGAPLNYLNLLGGLDSAQVTDATLIGQIDQTTQDRSGLFSLRDTSYGGPVVVTEGFVTDTSRAALYAYVSDMAGIYLDASPVDLLPGAALTEKQHLEGLANSEVAYYVYPRARVSKSPTALTMSALGFIAGNIVRGVNRNIGNVQPPTGSTQIVDVQRSPNGRDQLVNDSNAKSLMDAGVGVLRVNGVGIDLTGMLTVKADPQQPATTKVYARMIMMTLIYGIGPALAQYNNAYVDAQGTFYNVVRGRIRDILKPYWLNGVLYGPTVDDAFDVKMDIVLNSPADLARTGRARARVKVKISPVNEGIDLVIFNIPITQTF